MVGTLAVGCLELQCSVWPASLTHGTSSSMSDDVLSAALDRYDADNGSYEYFMAYSLVHLSHDTHISPWL